MLSDSLVFVGRKSIFANLVWQNEIFERDKMRDCGQKKAKKFAYMDNL